jgi:hypothetical protein
MKKRIETVKVPQQDLKNSYFYSFMRYFFMPKNRNDESVVNTRNVVRLSAFYIQICMSSEPQTKTSSSYRNSKATTLILG